MAKGSCNVWYFPDLNNDKIEITFQKDIHVIIY